MNDQVIKRTRAPKGQGRIFIGGRVDPAIMHLARQLAEEFNLATDTELINYAFKFLVDNNHTASSNSQTISQSSGW